MDVLNQIETGAAVVNMPQTGYIHTWPLAALAAASGLLALISIFLFKNRMRQVKFVAFAFLLNVVYLFLVFIWAVESYGGKVLTTGQTLQLANMSVSYSVATWASVASLVLLFLAQRAIKKDEAKVRAADRLR